MGEGLGSYVTSIGVPVFFPVLCFQKVFSVILSFRAGSYEARSRAT